MKTKLLAGVLVTAGASALALGLTACGESHNFSEEWSRDDNSH